MVSKVTPDTMLSASSLPAVMGLSRYRSPNDELDYSIRAIRGEEREDIGNEAMSWGNLMEPLILAQAAERLELTDLATEHPEARFHPELPLCCSLDGTADGRGQVIHSDPDKGVYVVGQDSITLDGIGVLEAKLTAVSPEEMPALYRGPVQLQAQMDIVQAKWGAVCVLYQGTEMRVFLFAPHEQTLASITQVATEFQAKLEKFRANGEVDYYPPSSSKDADRMFPTAADEVKQLDSYAEELARLIAAGKKKIKSVNEDIEKAEKELKSLLGTAARGIAGQFQISWPMRSYAATPQRIVPAKDAYSIRQSTLSIKEIK
jgi:predicted phage-related endonuclease